MLEAARPRNVVIGRISLSEPTDLEQVFTRYMDPVYRFLYSRVGNREDAEDLTSEVFLKASKQLEAGRAEASVAQWLFTVARTVMADHWRRYYRSGAPVQFDETRAPSLSEPSANAWSEESEARVAEILAPLPERYRRVLELRFLHGYTIAETASELGVTPENAKVIQHRALARAVQAVDSNG